MNLRRWMSIILALGLMVALSPLNALAWQNRPSNQQYHRGFTGHQPGGQAYGWHGQRPPMYRHHRPQFRGHYGYRHRNPGHQLNQGQWMSQRNNSRYPYGQSGYRGFPPSSTYPSYTNGQNTYGNWGQNYQGRYNHQRRYQGGAGTTPFPTTTTPQPSTGFAPQL